MDQHNLDDRYSTGPVSGVELSDSVLSELAKFADKIGLLSFEPMLRQGGPRNSKAEPSHHSGRHRAIRHDKDEQQAVIA